MLLFLMGVERGVREVRLLAVAAHVVATVDIVLAAALSALSLALRRRVCGAPGRLLGKWLTRWNLKCGVRCLSGYVVGTGLAGDPRLLLLLELGLVLFAWLGLGDGLLRLLDLSGVLLWWVVVLHGVL